MLLGLIRKEMVEPMIVKGNLSDSNHRQVSSFFRRGKKRTSEYKQWYARK